MKDEGGQLMNDFTGRVKRDVAKPTQGTSRTVTVALDTAQYQVCLESARQLSSKAAGQLILDSRMGMGQLDQSIARC